MQRAPRMALPSRPHRTGAVARQRGRGVRLTLDQARCAAGGAVSGRVTGLDSPASVAVLRVERRPGAVRAFELAGACVSPRDGAFSLTLPGEALPSTAGERCELRYVVRAQGAVACSGSDLVVVSSARPHLDLGSARADRLLANWDARHFHLELSDAWLEGGGVLAGRVHHHGSWPEGAIVVIARCLECWRVSNMPGRGFPQWCATPLWERASPLRLDAEATWAPFAFELPPNLPKAVEASTVAWRYELIARRSRKYWFDETAALTALLYERRPPTCWAFVRP